MTYERLLEAIDNGEEEVGVYLNNHILKDCLSGKRQCDIEYNIDKNLDISYDFMKVDMMQTRRYAVLRESENVYEIHLIAGYTDTLPAKTGGRFLNSDVRVDLQGKVSPEIATFGADISVSPYDVV